MKNRLPWKLLMSNMKIIESLKLQCDAHSEQFVVIINHFR